MLSVRSTRRPNTKLQGSILEAGEYHISPAQIDASKHFWNAFDNTETETSAGWLVRFAQRRGGMWEPFRFADIQGFYLERRRIVESKPRLKETFTFNRLIEPGDGVSARADGLVQVWDGGGWIVKRDGHYYFTSNFVDRCFNSSPALTTGR